MLCGERVGQDKKFSLPNLTFMIIVAVNTVLNSTMPVLHQATMDQVYKSRSWKVLYVAEIQYTFYVEEHAAHNPITVMTLVELRAQ